MAAILQARGVAKNFGAIVAAADINVDDPRGGDRRRHRLQRRRQDHLHQHGHRLPQALCRARSPSADRDITGLPPRQVTRTGVCRSFQIAQLFSGLTVLDNMLIALGMLREGRLSWLAPLNTAAREKPRRGRCSPATPSRSTRDALVSTLSAGRQQAARHRDGHGEQAPRSCCSTSRRAASPSTRSSASWTTSWRRCAPAARRACSSSTTWRSSSATPRACSPSTTVASSPTGRPSEVLDDPEVRKYVIGAELHRRT